MQVSCTWYPAMRRTVASQAELLDTEWRTSTTMPGCNTCQPGESGACRNADTGTAASPASNSPAQLTSLSTIFKPNRLWN